ncbi:SDR family NAD(P)-dependent oxidoreductase [Saccharopolyspora phatthalungensis]|uniref:NAD(P)-dependent dehydrogenase (Short-subunit alcohol dehydrogenase family) n=1 Tax=Saccharopolyspora phatthalungensis TaxID=664693 RepID=A0A840QK78_9PSEU|nr:SDR family oxidoreductase [Saccharopolyspora phatthalungensis]MBB5159998.1 NAD(P)-dependent dehydrogenase (short-subunit alcohol dehydrogenase family) [Saccharopolyspora phatthalungensis]
MSGRTVLLTGGARGLGRLFADALASAGANLVITARDRESLSVVAKELADRTDQVLACQADLTDPDAMTRVVSDATAAFGAVDILVNNAGVPGPHGPLWETDTDQWWHTLEVNLRGTTRACRAVLPAMTERGFGRIINIVSAAGKYRWPHASAYSVSKAAVIKLTENLAPETRDYGVVVLSYHPGLLDIGLTGDHLRQGPTGDVWTDRIGDWLQEQRDSGNFTTPERANEVLIQLAAGQADALSGRYLTVEDDLAALSKHAATKSSREQVLS